MTDKTTLGDRMKQYETTTQSHLLRRTPVIIRVDGRAFHTFTKWFIGQPKPRKGLHPEPYEDRWIVDPSLMQTPFSEMLHLIMTSTALSLVNHIQNATFAYTQSDEISIVLRDWDRLETQQWFGGNLQKMCSLSASIATAAFNFAHERVTGYRSTWFGDLAQFDSRVYNLPESEVTNYFIWRQQDATRNSVQMLGRHYYSAKQMHGKSNSQVQDMLMLLAKSVNWNDIDVWKKRGACVYQHPQWSPVLSSPRFFVDDTPPIFTQDRNYIEKHLKVPNDDLEAMVREAFEATKAGGDV